MIAAASHGVPVATYAPREVKKAVTDYGGSSKEQVQGWSRRCSDSQIPSNLLIGPMRLPSPSVTFSQHRQSASKCGSS